MENVFQWKTSIFQWKTLIIKIMNIGGRAGGHLVRQAGIWSGGQASAFCFQSNTLQLFECSSGTW